MSVFKAYDVRGRYPEEVSEKLAYDIGRTMVILLKAKNFLVARDARYGSEELSKAVIKGVTDQGADATTIGLVTTPMFYYFKFTKGFDAGIMITASHLPSGYNGLKAMRQGRGFMSLDKGYGEVKEMIESGKLEKIPLAEKKGNVFEKNYEEEYVKFITNNYIGDLNGLKVVVDGSNAMKGPILKKVLSKLGVDYIGLNMDYNMENPSHGLNPLKSEAQQQVKDKVLETGADLGAVFDADGDRIIIIDDKGEALPGDYTLAILTKFLAKPGDIIVHDLLSGRAFRESADAKGCKRVITRVGHVFIKQNMVEHNGRFGAEASGHMYFQESGGAESTILCLLDIMGILDQTKKALSELTAPLKASWLKSKELNYKVESNEMKDRKIEDVKEAFSDGNVSELDGVTIEYDNYWFNVRKSNTEPVLRLRLETKTQEQMDELIAKIEDIINS